MTSRFPAEGAGRGERKRHRAEHLVLALTCAGLLLFSPSAAHPFHDPKRTLFALAALLGTLATAPRWNWAALPLIVVCTLRPSVEWLAFAWSLAAFPALISAPRRWINALTWTATLIAVVVLLQAAGLDPFVRFAPDAPGTRLARYGTLGNPDFVASVLLPLAVLAAQAARWRLLLVAAALALTGSLGVVLGVGAAGLAYLLHRRGRARPTWVISAAVLLALTPLSSRDVATALRGRAYLASVALPQVKDGPLLGQGSGVVAGLWPEWELRHWEARCADAACVQAHPDTKFTGLQDHVHADWLEVLLERGVLGLVALLLVLGVAARRAWTDPNGALVFAALAAAVSRTLVDFPLERPADLWVLGVVASLSWAPGRRPLTPALAPPRGVARAPKRA